MSDSMSRAEAVKMMQMALEKQKQMYEQKLADQPRQYNNVKGHKRDREFLRKLAVVREGVEARAFRSFGHNAIGNFLREKGLKCGGDTAGRILIELEQEKLIVTKPSGTRSYRDAALSVQCVNRRAR